MSPLTQVKGQHNRPKDESGNLVHVLQPGGGYSLIDLANHTKSLGWKSNIFPDPSRPDDFPYWDIYKTDKNCPEVWVSKFGEVACSFDRYEEESKYRILQQQWNYQGQQPESQKYLQVWFNVNPYYPITHTATNLHSMVAFVHRPFTQDCVYWSERDQGYKLKPKIQVDHLDKEKSNNSYCNLSWVNSELNQRMRNMSVEEKRSLMSQRNVLIDNDYIIQ